MDKVARYHRRCFLILLTLLCVAAAVTLLSVYAGSYRVSFGDTILGIFNRAPDSRINIIMRNTRLPRALTALCGGWALGISGCVLQSILRNPLASASTLGISQGAAFGAAFAIIVLGAARAGQAGTALVSACAFAGSMGVSVTILALSRFVRISPEAMILAGVAISALFSGATALIQYFANDVELSQLVFWTFGDLGRSGWREIRVMAVSALLASVLFFINRWKYNALESGEDSARTLGVNVRGQRLLNMFVCSLATALVVSIAGLINFIGLIAPHIVRRFIGNNHAWLLPASALMGAILLLLGDMAARLVIAPVILPIGAISSFLGAPLFLYLLFRGAGSRP
ncbi:MAG: iron ABC transporter permease [Spirochaetaceae bacterium]|jgi:iron complex transport system permease protein|nr:iron ABC transporter permease [Spirochaetaceae bacterium]